MSTADLLLDLADDCAIEAVRAIAKYPSKNGMFVALLCEAGELATALRSGDAARIRAEAQQVAAVALRIALHGDNDAADAFCPLRALGDEHRLRARYEAALNHLASWDEGAAVNGSFDEPGSAAAAREALADE